MGGALGDVTLNEPAWERNPGRLFLRAGDHSAAQYSIAFHLTLV